jgi:hypothetical protein
VPSTKSVRYLPPPFGAMQERLWKLATCRKIAAEAAAYGSTWWERLRETNHIYGSSVGAGGPTVRQQAKEYYQKVRHHLGVDAEASEFLQFPR